jgi:hypothetical protein
VDIEHRLLLDEPLRVAIFASREYFTSSKRRCRSPGALWIEDPAVALEAPKARSFFATPLAVCDEIAEDLIAGPARRHTAHLAQVAEVGNLFGEAERAGTGRCPPRS